MTEDSLKKKTDRQKSIIPLLLRHKIPIEKLDIERLPKKKGFVRFPRNRMVPSSERPNLHFVGSAEPMPNHDLSGRTDAEPMPNLNQ